MTRNLTDAQKAYAQHQEWIAQMLARLDTLLEQHARQAAEKPTNWGFAGDLGHVEEILDKAVTFLGAP
jgi:hypothetical protein